ncbi:hypothetical protein DY000_02058473 [Brassica cretica]|uniref:Uncharacterized protein n=1 Tax=Brassica cretica TaxID=69181 RepID=A0ABQ7ATT6_BRACR|nr:hypothetical protein DY000_02058473 [Brassica cretica]
MVTIQTSGDPEYFRAAATWGTSLERCRSSTVEEQPLDFKSERRIDELAISKKVDKLWRCEGLI